MSKHIAIYLRVSSRSQSTRSQEPDLQRWADAQQQPVKIYRDKFSGRTMDRPGWQQLETAMRLGQVCTVCVWRLDRLGRNVSGLAQLFEDLQARKINLVSLRDGLDLSTPAGRLMSHILASVSAYESEVRNERQQAGIEAALAAGKRWGGSKPGVRKRVTPAKEIAIRSMRQAGEPITAIAAAVGLSRPTVYDVLAAV